MFEDKLHALEEQHLLRHLRVIDSAPGPTVTIAGRPIILMASNDYLGLATHPALKQAAIDATERFGVGSGASRLISGTLRPHNELERTLADFKQTESALVFGSGYLANIGLIPALVDSAGLILADRLSHASLIDGSRLSGAAFRVFRHGDMRQLQGLLDKRSASRETLIVTEGIFSMDGDAAPLVEMADLAERYGARLLVDDAHGTGVMGCTGRGTLEHCGVESRIPFHMGTLSKAIGTSGAYVVGPASLIQYLINRARPMMFSTAPPPATAAAAAAAIRVLQSEPQRLTRLWNNQRYFVEGLRELKFHLTPTVSPIIPVMIGNAQKAEAFAKRLLELGVYAPAIRPPTVPKDTSRIRTTVTAEHTREQLDQALGAFATAGMELGLFHRQN
ncbi:MAG TPA: 8-amino-7-oxononanoate synthase [Nitrospiraceae bacterium]|nr:8-amino-7-oxononanoate synthase [Nitrospiraceae bacterium]